MLKLPLKTPVNIYLTDAYKCITNVEKSISNQQFSNGLTKVK